MYKIKNAIKVGDWGIVDNALYAIQNNNINKLDLLGDFINTIYNLSNYWGVNYYKNFIHIFTMYSENIIIDYGGKELFKKDDFSFYHFYSSDNYIGFDRKMKKVVNSDSKILYNEKMSKILFYENKIIFTKKYDADINLIDLNYPESPIWQIDLTTLGTYTNYNNETQNYKVEKILGIHNERLYLGLSGSLIVELDIATGDITYQWHKLPKQFVKHPSDGFSARYFDLDKENNQLICIAGRRYDTIDLDTKTYNSVDTTKELEQYDIVSITRQGDFTNEHVSAIAHLKNDTWFQDGIVMFNRKTNRIDFFYKDKTFATGTDKPKIAGDKLYQLALDGTLYIFKKQENETV